MRASVLGGSGYIGGELIRLLLGHPAFKLTHATSSRCQGRRIASINPNLLGLTDAGFVHPDQLGECDVLFSAVPHRTAMRVLPGLLDRAAVVIDLSADFRLRDPQRYQAAYGQPHASPELLDEFVPGIPELYPDQLRTADRIAVPGCMANAAILALAPLATERLLRGRVVVDARTGSSGSGREPSPASHHPARSGALRVYEVDNHRHRHEISQQLGVPVDMTATAVEAVRGVQVVCRAELHRELTAPQLRSLYVQRYQRSPFVRLRWGRTGAPRLPEPKPLGGTNFCDIGIVPGAQPRQVVVVAALDNLVKGGAGNALQCANLRMGMDQRAGLEFAGLYPV